MKLNKTILAAGLVLGFASMANAADQGHGTVTFTGSIIDAPCSIAPESIDQTVNLVRSLMLLCRMVANQRHVTSRSNWKTVTLLLWTLLLLLSAAWNQQP